MTSVDTPFEILGPEELAQAMPRSNRNAMQEIDKVNERFERLQRWVAQLDQLVREHDRQLNP